MSAATLLSARDRARRALIALASGGRGELWLGWAGLDVPVGGNVGEWRGQANGIAATQITSSKKPIRNANGLDVGFDGGDVLAINATLNYTSRTILYVAALTSGGTTRALISFGGSGNFLGMTSASRPRVNYADGSAVATICEASSGPGAAIHSLSARQIVLGSDVVTDMTLDNAALSLTNTPLATGMTAPSGVAYIGGGNTTPTLAWIGSIRGLLVLDYALSDALRDASEAALRRLCLL